MRRSLVLVCIALSSAVGWLTVTRVREDRLFRAWSIVAVTDGRGGDCGRALALKLLAGRGESLGGVSLKNAHLDNLILHDGWFVGADFTGASLFQADLTRGYLRWACLRNTTLVGSNLTDTWLQSADLTDADLAYSHLPDARFHRATLHRANFLESDLARVEFKEVDATGAYFGKCSMRGVDLAGADLTNASLWYADLDGMTGWETIRGIEGCNIFEVRNAPEGFEAWALAHGAVAMPQIEWRAWQNEALASAEIAGD